MQYENWNVFLQSSGDSIGAKYRGVFYFAAHIVVKLCYTRGGKKRVILVVKMAYKKPF